MALRPRAIALAVVTVSLLPVASCRRDQARAPERTASSTQARAATSPASSGAFITHRPVELDSAAKQIIGFLRGEVGFDRIRVADTVTFYVSPEGGGSRAEIARAQLRDPSNWKVRGLGGALRSLVPPDGMTKLTTRVGRHLNCFEYTLSSRYVEFAHLPHVGTKLEPVNASSCLQSRNLTLVFDPHERRPTLIAAVYDQWEW